MSVLFCNKIVVWPLAALDRISHPVKEDDPKYGGHKPYKTEWQTNLAAKVIWHFGVVPNAQPQPKVEDIPRDELYRRNSRISPAEAALRTGFADQSHFSRFFTQFIGVPPAAYRRGCKEGQHEYRE